MQEVVRTIKDTKLLIQKENFFQKFVKHKMATVAFMIIAIEVIIVFLGPVLFDIDPYFMDSSSLAKPPSSVHLLGTDDIGRDIFARMLYGGPVSYTHLDVYKRQFIYWQTARNVSILKSIII